MTQIVAVLIAVVAVIPATWQAYSASRSAKRIEHHVQGDGKGTLIETVTRIDRRLANHEHVVAGIDERLEGVEAVTFRLATKSYDEWIAAGRPERRQRQART